MAEPRLPRNVLIFGATGAIGPYLAQAVLQSKDAFNKVAIFTSSDTLLRKSAEIEAFRTQGAEIVTGDIYNEEDVKRVYRGRSLNFQ